jgi:hypothetical protein
MAQRLSEDENFMTQIVSRERFSCHTTSSLCQQKELRYIGPARERKVEGNNEQRKKERRKGRRMRRRENGNKREHKD